MFGGEEHIYAAIDSRDDIAAHLLGRQGPSLGKVVIMLELGHIVFFGLVYMIWHVIHDSVSTKGV